MVSFNEILELLKFLCKQIPEVSVWHNFMSFFFCLHRDIMKGGRLFIKLISQFFPASRALIQWWSRSRWRNSSARRSPRTPLYPRCPHTALPQLPVTPLQHLCRTSLFPQQPTKVRSSLPFWPHKIPSPTSVTRPPVFSLPRLCSTQVLSFRQWFQGPTPNFWALWWCLLLAQNLAPPPMLQPPRQQLPQPTWVRIYSAPSNQLHQLSVLTCTNRPSHPTSCQARCSRLTVSRSPWVGILCCSTARSWMFSLSLQTWSNLYLWVSEWGSSHHLYL